MINLYLVPTPIGNIEDITYRAVKVLQECDVIYCEDTRTTKVLLSHYQITTPLKSYHIFNEDERVKEIILELKQGKKVALVSDAGYPGISDPGYLVCHEAIREGLVVSTIPGATASLTALVTSGLPCEKFYFYGFLAHTTSQKTKELESLIDYPETIIFYESPHRLKETMSIMKDIYKTRQVCIARELTKKYEEYIRGTCEEVCEKVQDIKGEIVIILSGADKSSLAIELTKKTIKEHFDYYHSQGFEDKEAMKMVAKDRGVSKSAIYSVIKA